MPSLTEFGWSPLITGIFKTTAQERGDSNGATWTRSGGRYSTECMYVSNGGYEWTTCTGSDVEALVRPAFHLNLKKVEEDAVRAITIPKSFKKTYTGEPLTAEGETWYTSLKSAIDDGLVSESYYKGDTKLDSAPTDAGNYKIVYKIENSDFMWSDQSSKPQEITFIIEPKEIVYPSISGDTSSGYRGGDPVRFQLKDFDKNLMDINWVESYDGVSINTTMKPYSVSANKKGDYELKATIKTEHKNNYKWASESKIQISVTAAELVVEKIVASGGNSSSLSISEGTAQLAVDVYIDPNGVPLGSDNNVPIKIVISYDGDDIEISAAMSVDNVGSALLKQNLINLDAFFKGDYTLGVKSCDDNYVAKLKTPATLKVLPAGQRTNILWSLYEGDDVRNDCRTITELNETGNKTLSKNLSYSGKQFRFEVTLPENYHLDGAYAPDNDGYKIEKISGDGSVLGLDAGTYRTSIRLVENNEIYGIEWTIDKAKFDLSNVKWKYDGKIPFSTNLSDMVAKIDESTLPKGLVVERYTGVTTGTSVGDADRASVTFKLDTADPSYGQNYELPTVGGKGSNYIYSGSGDFAWEINWEIEKLVIKLEWEAENYEGKYYRQKLKEDKNVVEYEYYLWDTANKTIVGEALSESEIEIEENVTKYYVAKAVIKDRYKNDVEFSGTNVISDPFAVGESATGVGVTLTSSELTYSGSAQPVKLRIDGGLSESDFEILYYDKDGTTALTEVPVNVGKYRVEIKIKESVSGYY
ncbi:MAG: hypothetical protein K2N32_05750, partial [Clostridia bacterium]|nr:hypothetical protein [Clostridia bacterium]